MTKGTTIEQPRGNSWLPTLPAAIRTTGIHWDSYLLNVRAIVCLCFLFQDVRAMAVVVKTVVVDAILVRR